MLKRLQLHKLGPIPDLDMTFGERLTVITGDNSLGKSFILDNAWWALTGVWPAEMNASLTSGLRARPKDTSSKITYEVTGDAQSDKKHESTFNIKAFAWKRPTGRPLNPGLVIYAMADGAFAVWDPARNYWNRPAEVPNKRPAYVFAARNVWDGIYIENERKWICEGLIRDFSKWLKSDEHLNSISSINHLLDVLSPDSTSKLRLGRVIDNYDPEESRDIPCITLPTGEEIPLPLASSAIKRITALVYLIHWAWQENHRFSNLYKEPPAKQLTLIIDEPEVHLHPKWQKKILPSLIETFSTLAKGNKIQVIASTHSPLVIGSLEGVFNSEQDAWYDIDFSEGAEKSSNIIKVTNRPFENLGSYGHWLKGEAFDLETDRTQNANEVYQKARNFIDTGSRDLKLASEINTLVNDAFSEEDPFRVRWNIFFTRITDDSND